MRGVSALPSGFPSIKRNCSCLLPGDAGVSTTLMIDPLKFDSLHLDRPSVQEVSVHMLEPEIDRDEIFLLVTRGWQCGPLGKMVTPRDMAKVPRYGKS